MREGKARTLIPAEQEVMIKVTGADKRHGLRNVAMLYLSHGAGLRVGEIAKLDVRHVLGEDGKIRDEFVLEKSNTKTKKSGTIYLTSKKLKDALAAYLAALPEAPPMDRALFLSAKGHRMGGNALQQVFARLYKVAGFQGCKSHTGRRTYATRLNRNGADLKSIKSLMRHESVTMTVQYIDDNPDALKQHTAKVV